MSPFTYTIHHMPTRRGRALFIGLSLLFTEPNKKKSFQGAKIIPLPTNGESDISKSLDGVSVSTSFAQSHFWDSDFSVSVSVLSVRLTLLQSRSRSCHWDSHLFSLGLVIETWRFRSRSWSRNWDSHISSLGLVIETHIFSVSVSSLRLRHFQSRSWSHPWDSDLLSLGLVIETETFSFSVSMIQIWSRGSLYLT